MKTIKQQRSDFIGSLFWQPMTVAIENVEAIMRA
jgi:hypothetical protein